MSRPANATGSHIHGALHMRYSHINSVTMFYGEAQAVYPEFSGVVLEKGGSGCLGSFLGENEKLLILRNHGLLTVGDTLNEAAYLFTLADRSCEIQFNTPVRLTKKREALYHDFQSGYEMELELSNARFLQ
ncbi:hypothetical protein BDV27DRAFT_146936 [Aspergillus caelatus]|uniref:Class II aldolase/adducin N-terminal domain-containing protein n=1 Tax=Aspergillus caelatus TaxID=61420 RepID=A0A5N6ZZZ4_9EURO|nr:uncharacterized protein BDV27DRAFT_146936 [Aspergillus caelatus]KAE8362499.1 hypothetical protein BDV27DRAFT_146936 [Aspergillus caelatus]